MSTVEVSGVVRGGVVVLDTDSPVIPEGTEVVVTMRPQSLSRAEIAAALRELPPLEPEDIEAFEQSLAEGDGKRPRTIAAGTLWAALRTRTAGSSEDYDELERSIEAGQQSMTQESPFADLESEHDAN